MSEERKMDNVIKFLSAYGSAIRGDWNHLDGRNVQSNLEKMCGYIRKSGMTDEELEHQVGDWLCLECGSWDRWCNCEDENNE